jgi:hypothetical protein
MSSSVLALREALQQRFPAAQPVRYGTAAPLPTGLAELDRALPGGGLPRGRLVAWAPGGGATALLRSACLAVHSAGERAAWVDGGGRLAGAYWPAGPVLIRPVGVEGALAAAEELLRSSGFGLVILTGVEELGDAGLRLARVAREGGGAFVAVGAAPVAPVRVASRIVPGAYRWRRDPFGAPAEVEAVVVRVRVAALGWGREAELELPVQGTTARLALDPGLVDRRGAVPKRATPSRWRSWR